MKTDKHSLQRRFDNAINELAPRVLAFPWAEREPYSFWLAQSHALVRHTSTYLALLAAKYGPEHPEAHQHTLSHLREETGHDSLAERDLRAMGKEVGQYPELLETAVLYQSQYFWIERGAPLAHYGYALMLEGLAAQVGRQIHEIVQKAHGKSASTFLLVHSKADEQHYPDGLAQLSTASPQAAEQALRNLDQSCTLYATMLTSILQTLGKQKEGDPSLRKKAA